MAKSLVSIMRLLLEIFSRNLLRIQDLFKNGKLMYEEADYWLPNILEMQLKISLSIFIHYPFIVHLVEDRANTCNQSLLDLIVSSYLVYIFLWEVIIKVLEVYYGIFYIEKSSHYFTDEETLAIAEILFSKRVWTEIDIYLLIKV